MHELIYAGNEVRQLLEKEYPDAKFEDASDMIHEERFSIDIDGEKDELEESFYVFAMKNGFVLDCFAFQIMLQLPTNQKEIDKTSTKINKWMDMAGIEHKQKELE